MKKSVQAKSQKTRRSARRFGGAPWAADPDAREEEVSTPEVPIGVTTSAESERRRMTESFREMGLTADY
ncbi:MAG TPA: hypothetical protein VL404_08405 [Candidatus Eisenbacteria bacterium]|jgi:hypothetical protein|nr:hypothetical protein [Candidatus Eisenbacteria bacterium]